MVEALVICMSNDKLFTYGEQSFSHREYNGTLKYGDQVGKTFNLKLITDIM